MELPLCLEVGYLQVFQPYDHGFLIHRNRNQCPSPDCLWLLPFLPTQVSRRYVQPTEPESRASTCPRQRG